MNWKSNFRNIRVGGGRPKVSYMYLFEEGGGNGQSEGPGGTSPTHGTMGGEFTLKIHKYTSTLSKISTHTHFKEVVY